MTHRVPIGAFFHLSFIYTRSALLLWGWVSLAPGVSKIGTAFAVGEALVPLLSGRMCHLIPIGLRESSGMETGAFFAPLPRRASLCWTGESGKLQQWVNREAPGGQGGKTQRDE